MAGASRDGLEEAVLVGTMQRCHTSSMAVGIIGNACCKVVIFHEYFPKRILLNSIG